MIEENNTRQSDIVIVSSIYEAKKLKKFNINSPVLCMNAEIFFFLKKTKNKKNFELIKFFLDRNIEENISNNSTNEFDNNYKNLKNFSISLSSVEIIKILILKNLYSLNAINSFLSKYKGFYFFINNKFKYSTYRELVIDNIFSKNQDDIGFNRTNKVSNKFNFLIRIINTIVFYFNTSYFNFFFN